jgi:hypothetical protein
MFRLPVIQQQTLLYDLRYMESGYEQGSAWGASKFKDLRCVKS